MTPSQAIRAWRYLAEYGWLEPVEWDARSERAAAPPAQIDVAAILRVLAEALEWLLGLNAVPDDLDGLLRRQRCRVPDRIARPQNAGVCQWPHREIRYHTAEAIRLPGVAPEVVQRAWRNAWASWAAVCGITPREVAERAEANVWAISSPIDGPSGVLAKSMLPCGMSDRGQCQQWYDSRDNWPSYGERFLQGVIAHELGHALGLDHDRPGSLMQPYASAEIWLPQASDIAQVRARYGPPRAVPNPTPNPTPTPTPNPNPTPVPTPTPGPGAPRWYLVVPRYDEPPA